MSPTANNNSNADTSLLADFIATAKTQKLDFPNLDGLIQAGEPLTLEVYKKAINTLKSHEVDRIVLLVRERILKVLKAQLADTLTAIDAPIVLSWSKTFELPTPEDVLDQLINAQEGAILRTRKELLSNAIDGKRSQEVFPQIGSKNKIVYDAESVLIGEINKKNEVVGKSVIHGRTPIPGMPAFDAGDYVCVPVVDNGPTELIVGYGLGSNYNLEIPTLLSVTSTPEYHVYIVSNDGASESSRAFVGGHNGNPSFTLTGNNIEILGNVILFTQGSGSTLSRVMVNIQKPHKRFKIPHHLIVEGSEDDHGIILTAPFEETVWMDGKKKTFGTAREGLWRRRGTQINFGDFLQL